MEPKRVLAANLRKLREEAGLSQGSLAELAGISLMAVYRIEAEARWPRPATLAALAKALGVTSEQLQGGGAPAETSPEDALRALAKHFGFRLVRA